MEDVEHENPAQSRSYEVTREYKVFRGDDKQPSSEVMAQISFVPPHTKTYKITQVEGKTRGEKMVRELLDQEVEAATKSHESEISRANYDFVFLRREKLEIADDYVLRIIPKRKEKYLFRGQIWVDTTALHIRRVEGVPAKNPSFWLTGIRITIQFAQVSDKWIPISFDATATVRFLGHYTIAGLNIPADNPPHSPCSSIQSRRALAATVVHEKLSAWSESLTAGSPPGSPIRLIAPLRICQTDLVGSKQHELDTRCPAVDRQDVHVGCSCMIPAARNSV
jgi:hypothetical protein